MRNIIKLLCFLLCTPFFFYAQSVEQCGTDVGFKNRLANDPGYKDFIDRFSGMTEDPANSNRIACDGANTIRVPVAFHFDESFSCANPTCLMQKIDAQLEVLNDAFGDLTTTANIIAMDAACPTEYPIGAVSSGTCIEFCMAVPPVNNGQGLIPGCDPAVTVGAFCGGINFCGAGAGPAWAGILNIFIVDAGGGLLGVADGIPGAGNGDGVTVTDGAFGGLENGQVCSSGNTLDNFNNFNRGGTLIHEIGHYLGLFHIWGDDGGACTGNDSPNSGPFNVNDTPNQADNNGNICPAIPTSCTGLVASCGSTDWWHNYMDYTCDQRTFMFTDDQAQVMNFWANQLFGSTTAICSDTPLTALPTTCDNTSCCTFVPTPDVATASCNSDGTQATVTINIIDAFGNITFDNPNVSGASPTYQIDVPVGAGCGPITLILTDNGTLESLSGNVEVVAPASIAGPISNVGYNAADWGIDGTQVSPCVSGILTSVNDGTGTLTDFCEPTPPATPTATQCAGLAGSIAVIDRGICTFTDKVTNAQACGATAVIICNNDTANPDSVIPMGGTSAIPITIPSIMLSFNECQTIYAEMALGDVEMCIGAPTPTPCERTITFNSCDISCDPSACNANNGTIQILIGN